MIGQSVSGDRWRSIAGGDCDWAEYDGDYVVFHRPSGQTHFVNAATALLLTEILCEPRSAEEAAVDLAACQAAPVDVDVYPRVLGLLVRLEELGLVERFRA